MKFLVPLPLGLAASRAAQATAPALKSAAFTDEAHVDERRASMDLGPLADYAKGFGFDYVPVK